MADIAHELTDRELEKMERHLSAIYARAEKELQEKVEAYFKRFEELDAKKRELVEAGKLTEKEYKRWRQNKMMTGRHWKQMKEQAAQELLQANRTAQEYINGRLPGVYSLNYNSAGEAIEGAVSGYSFELVDASTVKNLATSDKTLLPYKYVDGKKDVRWNTAKVNAEVLQGIVQGESIPNIAKRLQNVTEMNRASAIRNARTTVTSAENKGRMDSLHAAAEKGVITHKVWLAAIDARTREAHRLLDGQEKEIDDPFESELGDIMFPGDPDADPANVYNCRCTLIYKVIGFGTKDIPSETLGDSVLWSRDNLALMRDATQDIVDEGEYAYYGLRAQNRDTEKIGETITHLSKNFGGDFEDLSAESEVLNGVSTIGINDINKVTEYGGYEGRVVYLVGSDSYEYGYDPGEKIMEDAVVLAKGKIENGELKIIERIEVSGNTEIVENTAENAITNAVINEAMQEYLDFKDRMIKKYGAENMWRDMTDAEMDMLEKLERKAYKGY